VTPVDYVIRVLNSPAEVNAVDWNGLLDLQLEPNPFMHHAYLAALHDSGSAVASTGWTCRFMTLWRADDLVAACPLYVKTHSYGEYVFDWAWANAYQQHGLRYYPKATVAVPFTPVPGARLLARNPADRVALVHALREWCVAQKMSSLHMLFANDDDVAACESAGLMLRHTVQFHWTNVAPTLVASRTALPPEGAHFALGAARRQNTAPTLVASRTALPPEGAHFALGAARRQNILSPVNTAERRFVDFDDFLASLSQEKRKKIRQERRKVLDSGVTFKWARGSDITTDEWDFFYRCYSQTYLEHGNAPYLSRDFFARMADTLPEAWLLFTAYHGDEAIATSLIAIKQANTGAIDTFDSKVAYGRYWGAIKRVDCLHFEACYYQPLAWCIQHGFDRFEGGAQGEHKMARALMPVKTTSAHWLAHPAFADAVEQFLQREGQGIAHYLEDLSGRSPFKQASAQVNGPAHAE
jgi:uncharacterized protein